MKVAAIARGLNKMLRLKRYTRPQPHIEQFTKHWMILSSQDSSQLRHVCIASIVECDGAFCKELLTFQDVL